MHRLAWVLLAGLALAQPSEAKRPQVDRPKPPAFLVADLADRLWSRAPDGSLIRLRLADYRKAVKDQDWEAAVLAAEALDSLRPRPTISVLADERWEWRCQIGDLYVNGLQIEKAERETRVLAAISPDETAAQAAKRRRQPVSRCFRECAEPPAAKASTSMIIAALLGFASSLFTLGVEALIKRWLPIFQGLPAVLLTLVFVGGYVPRVEGAMRVAAVAGFVAAVGLVADVRLLVGRGEDPAGDDLPHPEERRHGGS